MENKISKNPQNPLLIIQGDNNDILCTDEHDTCTDEHDTCTDKDNLLNENERVEKSLAVPINLNSERVRIAWRCIFSYLPYIEGLNALSLTSKQMNALIRAELDYKKVNIQTLKILVKELKLLENSLDSPFFMALTSFDSRATILGLSFLLSISLLFAARFISNELDRYILDGVGGGMGLTSLGLTFFSAYKFDYERIKSKMGSYKQILDNPLVLEKEQEELLKEVEQLNANIIPSPI